MKTKTSVKAGAMRADTNGGAGGNGGDVGGSLATVAQPISRPR